MKLTRLVPVLLVLLLTGCGKGGLPSFVKGASVKTYTQDGKAWGEVDVSLNTGMFVLPALELPIVNPKKPADVLGQFSLKNILGGGSEVGIGLNISEIIHTPGFDGRSLPNGNPIPVAGIGDGAVSFPITSGGSRLYVAIGDKAAMVGFALVIKQFDQLAGYFGGIDVFLPVHLQNGITGTVGLFSSSSPSQSGLAVFLDVSSMLKASSSSQVTSLMISDLGYGIARARASEVSQSLSFNTTSLSAKKMRRINNGLNAVAARGQRVTVQ